jgi:chemotaxis protein MotB
MARRRRPGPDMMLSSPPEASATKEVCPLITRMNRQFIVAPMLSTMVLAGCVSQSKYDALQAQNEQLHQQVAAQSAEVAAKQAQISRLQGAIKYTVNSDLLFPSGGWEMSAPGKEIIAKFAVKLAPTQQNKLLVNGYTDDAPIGRALQKNGITSNQELSQKRAENVMQFLISQGVKSDLVSAHGYGDADPVAPNTTPKGRAQNRRVELTLGGSAS